MCSGSDVDRYFRFEAVARSQEGCRLPSCSEVAHPEALVHAVILYLLSVKIHSISTAMLTGQLITINPAVSDD